MGIGIHDSDQTKFPNLALMKLSESHKNKGDDVSFFEPGKNYDWVYSSKVFTFTSTDPLLPINSIKGGTGYSLDIYLPYEIEHTMPDYSLYNLDYSVGFLTRGCPKKCKHCVVPLKEGDIVPNADITEFLDHNEAVLLDNNVLASKHGIT